MSSSKYQPHLSFIQILNMTFGFFGIQFAVALHNINSDSLYLILAAPLTGLLIQPIIGYYSDHTSASSIGRRRPYIIVGSILAALSLALMPVFSNPWIVIGLFWVLSAAMNIMITPLHAIAADMLPSSQRMTGFAMQAFFISAGIVTASLFLSGEQFVSPYYICAAVLLISLLYTVIATKEYPIAKTREVVTNEDTLFTGQRFVYSGISFLSIGLLLGIGVVLLNLSFQVYILAGSFVLFAIVHFIAATRINKAAQSFVRDFHDMPPVMKQLLVVQFFSWFAMSGLLPNTTQDRSLIILSFEAATVTAVLLPVMSNLIGRKVTHLITLTIAAAGLLYSFFDQNISWALATVGLGIAMASMLSIPYAILSDSLPKSKTGYYMGVFNAFIVVSQIGAAGLWPFFNSFFSQSSYTLLLAGVSMVIGALLTLKIRME